MTQEQLPAWVKVGSKCCYFSESQKQLHPVVVTSVDVVKKRIIVHFEANHSIWKTIPFDLAGRNGSLRPPGASVEDRNGLTSKEKRDGTSTPPWYDNLVMTTAHEDRTREEEKKKSEELLAQQERRRYAWEEEKRRQQEEKAQAREMDRIRREEEAEAQRILIVQRLQREREEEIRRQQEVHWMELADEACTKVNGVWRQRELARRRQEEEERQAEEEEAQRLAEEQYQKELAARPRVSFGVKLKPEPARIHIPQQSGTTYGDGIEEHPDNRRLIDASGMTDTAYLDGEPISAEPEEDHESTLSRSRWAANSQSQYEQERPPGEWGDASQHSFAKPPSRAVPSRMMALPPQEVEYDTAADWYHAHVRAIYEVHNPSKLAEVPGLLEKYSDCHAEMYERICKKYGVQPESIPSFSQRRTRSRSRYRGDQVAPCTTGKASGAPPGYARKASAPAPPQVDRAGRTTPAVLPSSSEQAQDATTSSMRARLETLMNRQAPRPSTAPSVSKASLRLQDSQRPPVSRDDIQCRRSRSDSRPCHREERGRASGPARTTPRPALTPRPPSGPPPPTARNGGDWRGGRDDSRNRQQDRRGDDFRRRRSESRHNHSQCDWEERREMGRSYDEHHHDRRRGDRVHLQAPLDRSRSSGGKDSYERHRVEPPWREERQGKERWEGSDGRGAGHRGPYDGGYRNSRSYDGY